MHNWIRSLAAGALALCLLAVPSLAQQGLLTPGQVLGNSGVSNAVPRGTALTATMIGLACSTAGGFVTSLGSGSAQCSTTAGSTATLRVGATANSANEFRVVGYQAAFQVLNQAATQNWYFGVDDNDSNKLKIGSGYSAGQGVAPNIIIDASNQVLIGNSYTAGLGSFTVSTSGSFGSGDWVAWFRHQGSAASNESLIRHEHYSDFAGTGAIPQPVFTGIANRGTIASPVTLGSGDYLLIIDGRGYDGSVTSDTAAQINFRTSQAWTAAHHGSKINFLTTPNNSISPATVWTMDQDGGLWAAGGARASVGAATINLAGITINNNAVVLPTALTGTLLQAGNADAALSIIDLDSFGINTYPQFSGRQSRGTAASQTATQSGDTLANFNGAGWGGGSYASTSGGGSFTVTASQNYTASNRGTQLDFHTTPNNSDASALVGRVENDGGLTWPNTVTGGSKGAGTVNVSGSYYINGTNIAPTPGGAALSKTDDTNITVTLGGSPSTALVNAASLTLGWTGQLSLSRGGSNNSLTASNGGVVYSDASKLVVATAFTGLVLATSGAAPAAYGGTSCTNQFPRSLSASGAATCATVANTDLANSSVTYGTTSVALGASSTSIAGLTSIGLTSGSTINWNSDTYLGRAAAANITLGQADAAAPVAQTLSVQNVVTGTSNTAGQTLTIKGSAGTGTGAGGSILFQTADAGGTGTTPNAFVNKAIISSAGFSVYSGVYYPSVADSTTAFRFTKADGTTNIMVIDSTNKRVGINKTPGAFDLDVNGAVNFASTLAVTGHVTVEGVTSTGATGTGKFVFDASPTITTPTITTSAVIPIIGPPSNSTTAVKITKADLSTAVMTFDTTNARVGINKTPGAFDLDVNGAVNLASTLAVSGHVTLEGVTSTGATGTGNLAFSASPTFTGTMLASAITASSTISMSASTNGQFAAQFTNSSNGASAYSGSQFGNDSGAGQAGFQLNSSANTSLGGASSFNIGNYAFAPLTFATNSAVRLTIAAGGGITMATGNPLTISDTTASTSKTTGALIVSGGAGIAGKVTTDTLNVITMANTATTSAVCYNTSTGLLTYDGTIGTCTVSLLAAKNLVGRLSPAEGLRIVMAMEPWRYTMKEGLPTWVAGEQIGFVADYAEHVDKRIVAFNHDGTLAGMRYEQYTAVLTAAFKALKADNDNLRAEVDKLKRRSAR